AGDHRNGGRGQTVGRPRRALRSPGARQQRQLAGAEGRGRAAAPPPPPPSGGRHPGAGRGGTAVEEGAAAATPGRGLGTGGGRAAFAAKPAVALPQLSAYLNFDMVGRMQDNRLAVQALGSSTAWSRIIEQANVAAGFDLQLQPDPYQPTDVATFNQAEVPSLN